MLKDLTQPKIVSIFVNPNSIYCGMHLTSIKIPQKCALLGILRNSEIINIYDEPIIQPGDFILSIAIHPMMLPSLKVTLKKVYPIQSYWHNLAVNGESNISAKL